MAAFSQKMMWLNCGKTNSDPSVIAQMYVNCVAEFGVCPRRLRTDCGTENGTMAALQCTLRSEHVDEFAGAKSHMYGTSTSNQRIDSWWSYFQKQRFGWLISLMLYSTLDNCIFYLHLYHFQIICIFLCFLKEIVYPHE